MSKLRNDMVDKLLLLISEGKEVHSVTFRNQSIPPKHVYYELKDGSCETLNIALDKEQFDTAYKLIKAWWNAVHKVKIEDIEI